MLSDIIYSISDMSLALMSSSKESIKFQVLGESSVSKVTYLISPTVVFDKPLVT